MPEALADRELLEKLERLALHWRRSFQGLVGGHNRSRMQGYGQEFLDHRNFYPGDDLRAVNWRAYLRFERFLLKTFQMEPRVPIRLLLDTSASMTIAGSKNETTKFDYARQLALALVYIGLVKLDSVAVQPFAASLFPPLYATGGRQRISETEQFLRGLKPAGRTDFGSAAKQFLLSHAKPGLVIVISDFLSDGDCFAPLQAVCDARHELLLVQLWSWQDRHPHFDGATELVDVEDGKQRRVHIDAVARQQYQRRMDEHSAALGRLAMRNGGRFVDLCTRTPVEEALFGPMQAVIGRN
jgi:uncharacterized protein (DUF58 family)